MVRIEDSAEPSFAARREAKRLGIAMAAIMPIMATTINSSISENPSRRLICCMVLILKKIDTQFGYKTILSLAIRKGRGRESELCPRHVLVASWYLVAHRNPSGPDSRCVVGWRRIADLGAKDTVFSNGETAIAGSGNRSHIMRIGGRVEGGWRTWIQVGRRTQEVVTAL